MRIRLTLLVAALAAPCVAQVPASPDFLVNTYTTGNQGGGRLAVDRAGRFVVSWTSNPQDAYSFGVYAQRYSADGTRVGGEFLVPTVTSSIEALSDVAYGPNGNSLVVWHGDGTPGFDIHAQRYARDGTPQGGEFVVNTVTSGNEYRPRVAGMPGGGFVVAWSAHTYAPNTSRIVTRRYDSFGVPLGPEVQVNLTGASSNFPSVATGDDGRYVVVWQDVVSPSFIVAARLYDANGAPMGPPFQVNNTPIRGFPDVAMAGNGSFMAVWEATDDIITSGIRGRVFSPGGTPVAPDFLVNAGTTGDQLNPAVSADRRGNFVVGWRSKPGPTEVSVARRFTAAGAPRSGDFVVNGTLTGSRFFSDVASDEVGNFVVAFDANDGNNYGQFARRFGGLLPAALAVDSTASASSDGNGVLEPGETADVRPSWRSVNAAAQTFSGTVPTFTGPGSVFDGAGNYGIVAPYAPAPCIDCYSLSVTAMTPRPVQHWDAFADEDIAPDVQGQRKRWRLHVGDSFADVPRSSPFYRWVETLIHHFVTAGCTATDYCPGAPTTREQMAVFVVVARDHAGDSPPACITSTFPDVQPASVYCRWIEELVRTGVVTGCGGGNFCPSDPVRREEMAVFTLRTLEPTLAPPLCTAPMFADVPASSPFCPWIEELARRGVVTGCGSGNYCPQAAVTREQMAVFISGTFGLQLYGP